MNTREVQAALLSRGYNPGSVDGLMGLKTRFALGAFQRAAGLYPDGIAGPKTWLALQAGKPTNPEPAPPRQCRRPALPA